MFSPHPKKASVKLAFLVLAQVGPKKFFALLPESASQTSLLAQSALNPYGNQLVALDIDGTLLDSHGKLPFENGHAIEARPERCEDRPCQRARWSTPKVSAALGYLSRRRSQRSTYSFSIDVHRLSSCFMSPTLLRNFWLIPQHFSYLVLHRDEDFNGQTVIHPACRKNLMMQAIWTNSGCRDETESHVVG